MSRWHAEMRKKFNKFIVLVFNDNETHDQQSMHGRNITFYLGALYCKDLAILLYKVYAQACLSVTDLEGYFDQHFSSLHKIFSIEASLYQSK